MTRTRSGSIAVAALAVPVLAALIWVVLFVPDLLVPTGGPMPLTAAERVAAATGIRGQLITFLTAIGGVTAVVYGIRRFYLDKDKQRLDEDKHLTEVFDRAAGKSTADDPLTRAFGIRTLARLMTDSTRDHEPILASILDILRRHAVAPSPTESAIGTTPPDVTAATEALRTRPDRPERRAIDLCGVWLRHADLAGVALPAAILGRDARAGSEPRTADLDGADLTGADLTAAQWPHARLRGARLRSARLESAILRRGDLTGADLTGAVAAGTDLADAVLTGADLTRTNLRGADLRRARFHSATLDRTDLTGADLTGTDFTGTDLRTVTGLTADALRTTIIDGSTALPPGLIHPEPSR